MYNSVKEKIVFNKNRAKQILDEGLYVPNIILDLYKIYNKKQVMGNPNYQEIMDFQYDNKKDKL